jgi:hypothetical protein
MTMLAAPLGLQPFRFIAEVADQDVLAEHFGRGITIARGNELDRVTSSMWPMLRQNHRRS